MYKKFTVKNFCFLFQNTSILLCEKLNQLKMEICALSFQYVSLTSIQINQQNKQENFKLLQHCTGNTGISFLLLVSFFKTIYLALSFFMPVDKVLMIQTQVSLYLTIQFLGNYQKLYNICNPQLQMMKSRNSDLQRQNGQSDETENQNTPLRAYDLPKLNNQTINLGDIKRKQQENIFAKILQLKNFALFSPRYVAIFLCALAVFMIMINLKKYFVHQTEVQILNVKKINLPGKQNFRDLKQDWESYKILNQEEVASDHDREQQFHRQPQIIDQQVAENFMSTQLQQLVKSTRYYDIHYFVEDSHTQKGPRIIMKAKKRQITAVNQTRPLFNITKSKSQLDLIINKMMYPPDRPQKMPDWEVYRPRTKHQLDLIYYFYQLSSYPENKNYLEAEYYRYDKLYNIGDYGKQLPLCIVVVGRNNAKDVKAMYESIRRQNYTNYRVVHVDDNSNDDTHQITLDYFKDKPEFRDRITMVSQRYQRNALYNRNFGVNQYCEDGDIVIDMDADDWIVGRQVFQLVNSLYQAGNVHNGIRQELWCAYLTNMGYIEGCCPHASLFGQIDQDILNKQLYRSQGRWRTTQLRTYLWKFYQKVDKSDMIDDLMLKKGQFQVQTYDSYMQSGMVEMANPKHIRILDQIVYFYTGSPSKASFIEVYHSTITAQTLNPYERINTLDDPPVRNKLFPHKAQKIAEYHKKRTQITEKRRLLKQNILKMYERDRNFYKSFQKRSIFNKENEGKTLGEQQVFKISVSEFKNLNLKPNFNYSQYGMHDAIQVGSQFDYLNISQIVNFTELERKMFDSVAHQVLEFNFNQSLQTEKTKLTYKAFPNEGQIQKFLNQVTVKSPDNKIIEHDIQYYLGSLLAMPNIDQKTKQLQYYYLNKKYKISQNKDEIPICFYASGYNLITQNKYKNFFSSIQRLNYTNFHIVYIDDYSPDNTSYEIYKYLNQTSMRIKNRIKIVRNLQRLQILANMHVWIKTYCNPDDVVIILDADDSIIGTQSLQILNSLYQNPNHWYVYSRFLMLSDNVGQFWMGPSSRPFPEPLFRYRVAEQNWATSHLRSFRRKVIDAVPLEHFIQFYYNKTQEVVYPRYHRSAADRFLAYSNLEVCGENRIHFITDFFYLYDPNLVNDCHRAHQMFEQYKARIKTPLMPLKDGQKRCGYLPKGNEMNKLLPKIKNHYQKYAACKKQLHLS